MRFARSALTITVWLLVLVLGAVTLLGFFDRVSWEFEVAGFFRLQYAVVLGLIAVLALVARRHVAVVAALAFAGLNLAVVAPSDAPAAQSAAGDRIVRVLVANVQYDNPDHAPMARLVRETNADVVLLTELTPAWASALADVLEPYPSRRVAFAGRAYGIGFYSRLPMTRSTVERFPHGDGPPTIVARLDAGDASFTFVGTHVHRPLEGAIHEAQIRALAAARPQLGSPLAICGDFNTVPWSSQFRLLTDGAHLTQLYAGSWPTRTWPTWSPVLRLTLDNCLVDGLSIRGHELGADVGSDHYPLIVELGVPD